MMAERGIKVAHSTILRWVTRYVPEFEKRWNRFSKAVGTSWHVDETYVSIKAKWHYLYRARFLRAYSDEGDRRFRFIVTGLERGEVLGGNDNSVGHDGIGVGTIFRRFAGAA
jgi:DDE domain